MMINVEELKPHPRNNEFFDDMSGEKWSEFLSSVKMRGIIEPIVITKDKMIVSGHQRVRACKELGIDKIECDIRLYNNEDEILQDLLETNIRQRGDVGGSAKKVGKRIKELERLYGIQHGNNQHGDEKNSCPKTQSQLASDMGMDVRTLQNYKLLADMIPELSDLLDTGIVTKTTALAIMKELSEEEQNELIRSMDVTKRITKTEVQQYVDEIKRLKENPTKHADYDSTKQELQDYKSDYSNLKSKFDEKVKELQDLRKQMECQKSQTPENQYSKKLTDSTLLFCSKVATFIEQVGGYVWLTDEINKIPVLEREGYIKAVRAIKSWADTMECNINDNLRKDD